MFDFYFYTLIFVFYLNRGRFFQGLHHFVQTLFQVQFSAAGQFVGRLFAIDTDSVIAGKFFHDFFERLLVKLVISVFPSHIIVGIDCCDFPFMYFAVVGKHLVRSQDIFAFVEVYFNFPTD